MSRNVLSLTEGIEEYSSFSNYFRGSAEQKNEKLVRMKKILRTAIINELTERQKKCIELYFFEKMKVSEIAALLDIRPTTVYKHISKAKTAIKKSFVYL